MSSTIACVANGKYLSVAAPPGTRVDLWDRDDGSGRQRWTLVPTGDADGSVYVQLGEAARSNWRLTLSPDDVAVISTPCAPGKGQKFVWDGTSFRLSGSDEFLSWRQWDNGVDVWGSVGPEGRQSWKLGAAPAEAPTAPAAAPPATPPVAPPVAQPPVAPAAPPAAPPVAAPKLPAGRLMRIDPQLRLPGWGAASKRTRLSFDPSSHAMRIDYPAHPHASAGGTNWRFKPKGVKLPAREARVTFEVFFPRDFPFEASGSSAGKIGIGFRAGSGDASGGEWSSNGASFRLIWLGAEPWGSYACAYVYCEVKNPDDFRGSIDQRQDVLSTAVLTNGGMNLFRPEKTDTPCRFIKGQWNTCEMRMKLNGPGSHDGAVAMTINGVTQQLNDFRWTLPGSPTRIEEFWVSSWFGGSGSDPSWAPGRPTYSLLRNVRVRTI